MRGASNDWQNRITPLRLVIMQLSYSVVIVAHCRHTALISYDDDEAAAESPYGGMAGLVYSASFDIYYYSIAEPFIRDISLAIKSSSPCFAFTMPSQYAHGVMSHNRLYYYDAIIKYSSNVRRSPSASSEEMIDYA